MRAVDDRSQGCRDGHGAGPRPSRFVDVGVMQDDAVRNTKPSRDPRARQREVHARRHKVREIVKGKRRFVRIDSGAVGPEPERNEVLVIPSGKMHDAIDTATYPFNLASSQIPVEKLRRIACFGCLSSREVAFLRERRVEEPISTGPMCGCYHSHKTKRQVKLSAMDSFLRSSSRPEFGYLVIRIVLIAVERKLKGYAIRACDYPNGSPLGTYPAAPSRR